jgi:galacturan 1,4-alpha-galacturonidase
MQSLLSFAVLAAFTSLASASPYSPWGPPPSTPANNGKTCTVRPLGRSRDDTPQILNAFEECNNGGTVVFPEGQNYTIATKLNPVLYDVRVEWKGVWTVRVELRGARSHMLELKTDPS